MCRHMATTAGFEPAIFCFYCKETCLFYKVYAWPESDTIYRVFTCPVWSITITGTITLDTTTTKQTHNFVLHPARQHIWNSIEMTLIATTVPNLPFLASYFITDETTVSKVEASPAGMLLPHSVGQLQCTSKESAKKFSSCQFSSTICQCTSLVYEATCTCPEGNTTKYLNNAHQKLPLHGKDIVIAQRGSNIQAKTMTGSSTSIQMSLRGLSIFTRRSINDCRIEAETLTGCYSCFQGAHTKLSCTSSLSHETAEIRCDEQIQLVKCSPHGTISEITFHFSTAKINITCSVLCPAGRSKLNLHGTLNYVNEPIFQQSSLKHLDNHRTSPSGFSMDNLSNAVSTWISSFTFAFKYWKLILLALVVTFFAIQILRLLRKRTINATLIKKSR